MLDLIVLLVVIALLLLLNTRSWFWYAKSHQIGSHDGRAGRHGRQCDRTTEGTGHCRSAQLTATRTLADRAAPSSTATRGNP